MTVSGVVTTGSVEDGFLFMDLSEMEKLTGTFGTADVAEVSVAADSAELSALAAKIRREVPAVVPRQVKRVTRSETAVLSKLQALVVLVTLVVLGLTTICVGTTMTTVVAERRKEIGLRKALGAENGDIAAEFLGEGVLLGIPGGRLGSAFGWLFAQTVGANVFGRFVLFNFYLLPLTVFVSVLVTLAACLIPVRRAITVEPALVLRGE
jgi:putative ABC transport system permease protein